MKAAGILGSILTSNDNGVFIGQKTAALREREEKTKVQRRWPVVVSTKECTSGCCDKDEVDG